MNITEEESKSLQLHGCSVWNMKVVMAGFNYLLSIVWLLYSHNNQCSISGVILQNLIQADLTKRLNSTGWRQCYQEIKKQNTTRHNDFHLQSLTLALFLSKSWSSIVHGLLCCLGCSCLGFAVILKWPTTSSKWAMLEHTEKPKDLYKMKMSSDETEILIFFLIFFPQSIVAFTWEGIVFN